MTVVTFGELLLRLSPPGEERLLDSPVLHTNFGGAEANVAVALRHLGVPSSYITRLPENPLGDAALDALRREGVDVSRVLRGGSRLGLYFVEPGADLRTMRVVYDRRGSAFSEMAPADVDWKTALAGVRWLHGTGITPALGPLSRIVLLEAFTRANELGITTSLDLNYREALWRDQNPRDALEPIARRADVLIGNSEAMRIMLGIKPEGEAFGSIIANRFGCRAVAITEREVLGPKQHAWSAALFDNKTDTFARSARHVVHVVDRVGGGDSCTAGLIAALLAKQSPQDAVEFAAAAGALKLGQAGDFGRSSAAEVRRLVETARCS